MNEKKKKSETFIFAACPSEVPPLCCCCCCSAERVSSRLYFLPSLAPPGFSPVNDDASSQWQTSAEAAVGSSRVRPQDTKATGWTRSR